jgi:hypothetical protein
MWDKENSLKMDILESVREGESQTTRVFKKIQKYDKALPNNQHVFNGTCVDQGDDWGFTFHGGITTDRML